MRFTTVIFLICTSSFAFGQSAAIETIIKLEPKFKYRQQIKTSIDKQYFNYDSLKLHQLSREELDILLPDTGEFKDYPIPFCYSIEKKKDFWTIVFLFVGRGPGLILMNLSISGEINQIFKINSSIVDEGSYSLCETKFLDSERFNVITVEKGFKYGLDAAPNLMLGDSTNTTYRQEKDGKIVIVSQSKHQINQPY